MGELIFIGLGLHDELGMTLRGLDVARSCDQVFAEFYTGIMPGLSVERLEELLGRAVRLLSRSDVEEKAEVEVLSHAARGRVAILVPGDPMVATTHVDLRLRAHKAGIRTRIIHSASVASAISGVTGLQYYKFGRTVTIPMPHGGRLPESVYDFIKGNMGLGLHTLALLDIRAGDQRCLTIPEAIKGLLEIEARRHEGVLTESSLTVGVARIGAPDMVVRAGRAREVMELDFGDPPHSLVVPAKLHFMEAEALVAFAGADREMLVDYL